jgi:hypothetical protein
MKTANGTLLTLLLLISFNAYSNVSKQLREECFAGNRESCDIYLDSARSRGLLNDQMSYSDNTNINYSVLKQLREDCFAGDRDSCDVYLNSARSRGLLRD